MGGINLNSSAEKWIERGVRAVEHPRSSSQYDLALLQLTEPLTDYLPNLLPICLPEKETSFDGAFSYSSGWGQLSEGIILKHQAIVTAAQIYIIAVDFSGSEILQFVGLPIVSNSECSKAYQSYDNLPIDRQCICAGYPEGGKDSCKVKID